MLELQKQKILNFSSFSDPIWKWDSTAVDEKAWGHVVTPAYSLQECRDNSCFKWTFWNSEMNYFAVILCDKFKIRCRHFLFLALSNKAELSLCTWRSGCKQQFQISSQRLEHWSQMRLFTLLFAAIYAFGKRFIIIGLQKPDKSLAEII